MYNSFNLVLFDNFSKTEYIIRRTIPISKTFIALYYPIHLTSPAQAVISQYTSVESYPNANDFAGKLTVECVFPSSWVDLIGQLMLCTSNQKSGSVVGLSNSVGIPRVQIFYPEASNFITRLCVLSLIQMKTIISQNSDKNVVSKWKCYQYHKLFLKIRPLDDFLSHFT